MWLYIRELELDECKRKVQRCVSANRLSFSELFDDISALVLSQNWNSSASLAGPSWLCIDAKIFKVSGFLGFSFIALCSTSQNGSSSWVFWVIQFEVGLFRFSVSLFVYFSQNFEEIFILFRVGLFFLRGCLSIHRQCGFHNLFSSEGNE